MDTKKIIIAGAIAAGAYMLLSSRSAGAATLPKIADLPPRRLVAPDKLSAMLGAVFHVQPWSVQAIRFTPGNAIGNYAGLTQAAALEKATVDYSNQFLSPYSTGYGVVR